VGTEAEVVVGIHSHACAETVLGSSDTTCKLCGCDKVKKKIKETLKG
jgi:hypothetical protein